MEDATSPVEITQKDNTQNTRALSLIALFVVAIIPFLVHFNLLYAPMQGEELRLMLYDDALHHPDTAITQMGRISGSPLAAFFIGFFWQLGSGAVLVLRAAALLAWVVSALSAAQAIRLWLCRTDSVTAPLLGGLLYALSPVSVLALTAINIWPALFGLVFAVVALACFLQATKAAQLDYLSLVLSCIALALAAAAYPALLLLPLAFIVMDMTRLNAEGGLRLRPAWTAWGVTAGTSVAVALVFQYSGGSIILSTPGAFPLFLSVAAVLLLAWLMVVMPGKMLRTGLVLVMAVLVLASGAFSFHKALQYMDPLGALEQACSQSDDPENQEMLALQYLETSRNAADGETRLSLLQEAFAVWQQYCKDEVNATRRVLGQRLFESGNVEEAAQLLKPFLLEEPFEKIGYTTALALARATDAREMPRKVADYYAFAQQHGTLSAEDEMRYGKTLMQLGDTTGAARQFAALPDLDDGSELALLKKQANTAYSAAQGLLDKAREKITEDPNDPECYVISAQRELLLGNSTRSFYWLELALRRNPEMEQAWQLMGVIFAKHNQIDQFIAQWGETKPHGDQAWLKLAKQATLFQAWDSALILVNQFATEETPSAEEMMAAFALEMRNIKKAQEWLEQATLKHPDSFSPWLLRTDLAVALQQPDEAQKNLQEAEKRNAPAEEIEKRKTRLQGGSPEKPETTPFEPVRSYIQ